ncbi:MAG: nucleotide exchange factor GrpE [Clostridia bacterium]|nr:nucleotide exchange factor GrpE [Clostridia bacterium]MBQ7121655.1 nucleotide exchange factor GrpE [Clostridia bacterium]
MKKEKKKPEAVEEEAVETAESKLQKELDEKNEQFLRLCAEYDNFRKRSTKEKQDIYSSSQAEVIKELLPVLDNFDRAASNKDCSFEDYQKGIDLIFNQFGEILKKLKVESFGERGDEFDPNIHNAVMTVEDDELGENVIATVFSKGYKMGDRIIREAVVQVANS